MIYRRTSPASQSNFTTPSQIINDMDNHKQTVENIDQLFLWAMKEYLSSNVKESMPMFKKRFKETI